MRAVAVPVPLITDSVAPCRLTYGNLTIAGGDESRRDVASACLFFEIGGWEEAEEASGLGRVTFEGLDSVRASRGEVAPYDDGHDFSSWVYVVEGSSWLRERHDYEWANYQTPMLETHQHYVFRFHDDFVEAIAEGIWLDPVPEDDPFLIASPHPLVPLEPSHVDVATGVSSGLAWEVWSSKRSELELRRDSLLCSQPLFTFRLLLDESWSGETTCLLRASARGTRSRLTRPWVRTVAEFEGVASPEDAMPAWEAYCAEVAARRREMGK